ncbi:MAG: glycosyltransferase family 4 protein [Syntrophales bacterium]|jgi:glycosyltransferase involved in cell wall biosynthesis|nr:glycosyltransferase family 4 protein [Syntrophales bacterium]
MKIAIVTNIPAPYRNPVYSILDKFDDVDLLVLFCSHTEPNRNWKLPEIDYGHKFLSQKDDTYVHTNWNVLRELNRFNADVVITAGFNPTMLLAWTWAVLKRKKHIPFSDANLHAESKLSVFHRLIRKLVYKTSEAFIGASNKTLELFKAYKIDESRFFKSCLAIDNASFGSADSIEKKFDLLFCHQFNERKNPLFFVELAKIIDGLKPGIEVLLIGSGPLKEKTIDKLKEYRIKYHDAGFVQPADIIKLYQSSKIFVFPTRKDPWGLVANEALAAGLPVLVSSVAGVANELAIDGFNGFVFENFETQAWVEKIHQLLNDQALYDKISRNAIQSVERYTHSEAAKGIYDAARFITK